MCRKKTNFPNVDVILTLTNSPPYRLTTVLYDSAITGNAAERNFVKLKGEIPNEGEQKPCVSKPSPNRVSRILANSMWRIFDN